MMKLKMREIRRRKIIKSVSVMRMTKLFKLIDLCYKNISINKVFFNQRDNQIKFEGYASQKLNK